MPGGASYVHDVSKLSDNGLQLNLPVDLVPSSQYSYFTNAISRLEGQLQTRDGLLKDCTVGATPTPIHSIFRLNQVVPGINGERLFGLGQQLWTAPLPAGNVPVQLTAYTVAGTVFPAFPVGFDGTPLSMMTFRFDGDPQAWVIIANGNKMMKRKANYYEQLGLPAPTVQPIASVGGAGLLNGQYQWVYTYVNLVTLSESNPSAFSTDSGPSSETLRPTAFTNPAPFHPFESFFPVTLAWLNPGNAFDNIPGTFADGLGSPTNIACCIWSGFAAASIAYDTLYLHVILDVPTAVFGIGVQVDYSLDGGVTWNAAYATQTPIGSFESITSLPPGTDMTQLQVRGVAGESSGGVNNEIRIYEIFTVGAPTGGGGAELSLTNQSAVLCVAPPVDPQESAIRLYRRGGSLTDAFYFVSQSLVSSLSMGACGAGLLEIDDDLSDADIEAGPTADFDNDMPVTSVQSTNVPLKAIWPFAGRVLGCGDASRPEAVYFSKPGNADEWPSQNWVVTADPGIEMMNGFPWNLRCFAFSRERLYTLVLNAIQGVTFTPQETACRRGIKGRWAFCVGEKGIYFISKDGPYRSGGGPEESIADDFIRPLFPTFDAPGQSVNGYEAVNMDDEDGLRLERHNSEIWFDYTGATTGTRQTLIFDERKNRWRGYTRTGGLTASAVQMHYSEQGTVSRLLTGTIDANIYEGQLAVTDDGTSIQVHIRTGARDQSLALNLKEYGNVIFDLDPGGAAVGSEVIITPYANGDLLPQSQLKITGTGRQRVALDLQQGPDDDELYALNLAFDIQWNTESGTVNPVLYQCDILYRMEPAAMQHWEVPPNSLGMNGFFHLRDSYVTLRSNADVTMSTFLDGATSPIVYTIPSTAGKKLKVYVPFAANKVKLVGFSFDSAQDFRIYQPECELRIKQWVTDLGYATVPLFGAEEAT